MTTPVDRSESATKHDSPNRPKPSFLRTWLRRAFVLMVTAILLLLVTDFVVYRYHRHLIVGQPLVIPSTEDSLAGVFPPATGWSDDKLERARIYAEEAKATAFLAIHQGQLVAEWGDTSRRISVHSVRKSIVSTLYGIAQDKGLIDIEKTLAELGVDDDPPLTELERKARIKDLLTARSGIYHDSVKDDGGEGRPARGSHAPDEAFYYNNWSFNALGAIFEQQTKLSLGKAFKDWIADPVGMQDFRIEDVRYSTSSESVFPAYRFWVSARDLARFGVMFQQRGRWGDRQIIPEAWVDESVQSYSKVGTNGYGYMWWIRANGDWMATGTGGQKVIIDPARQLVLINRVDTGDGLGRALWFESGPRMNNTHMRKLKELILAAAPSASEGE